MMNRPFFLVVPFVLAMGFLQAYEHDCCMPSCENQCSSTVYVDWLYWNTRKCGLDYIWPQDRGCCSPDSPACTDESEETIATTFATQPNKTLGCGSSKSVKPSYTSGVRVGLRGESCDFDYGVRYTHYNNCKSDRFCPECLTCSNGCVTQGENGCVCSPYVGSRMHPGQSGFVQGNNISFARSSYDLDYNVVDIELGKPKRSCENSSRMFFGVQLAYIDQQLKTRYDGTTIPTCVGSETCEAEDIVAPQCRIHRVWEKCDMDAYGLYVGGEGNWTACGCLGIFARASIGALTAKFDRRFCETECNDPCVMNPVFGDYTLVNVKDDGYCVVTHAELAAGVEYGFNMCNCEFSVAAGYEFHSWSNMRGFMAFVDDCEKGAIARCTDDLGFDGLFVRLQAGF